MLWALQPAGLSVAIDMPKVERLRSVLFLSDFPTGGASPALKVENHFHFQGKWMSLVSLYKWKYFAHSSLRVRPLGAL
jgi:hypothetical protein